MGGIFRSFAEKGKTRRSGLEFPIESLRVGCLLPHRRNRSRALASGYHQRADLEARVAYCICGRGHYQIDPPVAIPLTFGA